MLDVAGEPRIPVFESFGEGAELLGATQVNFFVPGFDREFAISINDPALDRAVTALGQDASAETRERVARELARLLLMEKLRLHRNEPANFFGLRLYDDHPGILDSLRNLLAHS